jgi:hypothetical protein
MQKNQGDPRKLLRIPRSRNYMRRATHRTSISSLTISESRRTSQIVEFGFPASGKLRLRYVIVRIGERKIHFMQRHLAKQALQTT